MCYSLRPSDRVFAIFFIFAILPPLAASGQTTKAAEYKFPPESELKKPDAEMMEIVRQSLMSNDVLQASLGSFLVSVSGDRYSKMLDDEESSSISFSIAVDDAKRMTRIVFTSQDPFANAKALEFGQLTGEIPLNLGKNVDFLTTKDKQFYVDDLGRLSQIDGITDGDIPHNMLLNSIEESGFFFPEQLGTSAHVGAVSGTYPWEKRLKKEEIVLAKIAEPYVYVVFEGLVEQYTKYRTNVILKNQVPIYYEDFNISMYEDRITQIRSQGYSIIDWKKINNVLVPVKVTNVLYRGDRYEYTAQLEWLFGKNVKPYWFDKSTINKVGTDGSY